MGLEVGNHVQYFDPLLFTSNTNLVGFAKILRMQVVLIPKSIRKDLWTKATMPISSKDFPDVFEHERCLKLIVA